MSFWTLDKTRELIAGLKANIAKGEIARRMGISGGMVRAKARRIDPDKPAEIQVSKYARPKAQPKPKPVPVASESVPDGRKHLTDLGPHDCRFPYGTRPYTFCGEPKWDKTPYCEHHAAVCFVREKANG